MWYRSELEQNVGIEGQLIETVTFDPSRPRLPFDEDPFRGLVNLRSNAEVMTSEASGYYYWCQIAVNNTCLQPSPPGLINLTSAARENCTSSLYQYSITGPLCGGNNTQCTLNSSAQTPRTSDNTPIASLPSTINNQSLSTATSVPVTLRITDSSDNIACRTSGNLIDLGEKRCIGIFTGVSIVVVIIPFFLLVVFSVCRCMVVRKRRRKREKCIINVHRNK